MKYKDLLNEWLEDQRTYQKYSTYSLYCNIVQNHIIPDLGECDIDALTTDKIQAYALDKINHGSLVDDKGLSVRFVKDIIGVVASTSKKELNIKLPYTPPKQIDIFEKEDQIKLMNHLHSHMCPKNLGILLCMHTGIRIGELCALKWSDINLDTRTIKIEKTMIRTYTKADGSKLRITPPKSRSSVRIIPLNSTISYSVNLMQNSEDDTYVLTGTKRYIEPNKYRLYYNKMLKQLGIKHLKFHCLRHTFATRCIECGCDYKSLSQILGSVYIFGVGQLRPYASIYIHPRRVEGCYDLGYRLYFRF